MTLHELQTGYNALSNRVTELERILNAVLNNYRETAIMNIGAIEDATRMKRSIPKRADRNKEYRERQGVN